jgi:hypothetical protein
MREARRLALLQRQSMIADVARKQAMRGLAEALEAEARSQALATRSRRLVAASAPSAGATTGAALQGRAAFTAGLAQLAAGAGDAARDAALQSVWASDTLIRAETRAKRLTEMTAEARVALETVRARREAARGLPLARKLHSAAQD